MCLVGGRNARVAALFVFLLPHLMSLQLHVLFVFLFCPCPCSASCAFHLDSKPRIRCVSVGVLRLSTPAPPLHVCNELRAETCARVRAYVCASLGVRECVCVCLSVFVRLPVKARHRFISPAHERVGRVCCYDAAEDHRPFRGVLFGGGARAGKRVCWVVCSFLFLFSFFNISLASCLYRSGSRLLICYPCVYVCMRVLTLPSCVHIGM